MNEAEHITVCISMKHCSACQHLTLYKDDFFHFFPLPAHLLYQQDITKAPTELNVYDYEVHYITIFKKHTIHTITWNETKPLSILNP